MNLYEIKNLTKTFNRGKKNEIKAIDNVSFSIKKGETLGLVGETGSGKSTIGKTLIHLLKPSSGQILYAGEDINTFKRDQLKSFHKDVQMIFQDPLSSLDPRMKVKDIIAEGIDTFKLIPSKDQRDQKIAELLTMVGLDQRSADQYPFEFSGGQRQRVSIARTLAVEPKVIIADEPIASLDVSIQAQIVNLLADLQQKYQLTYLFIAHDLSMVKYISDRIAVMNQGQIVELAPAEKIYRHPIHPYTQNLLASVPVPDPDYERNRQQVSSNNQLKINPLPGKLVEIEPNHFVLQKKQD